MCSEAMPMDSIPPAQLPTGWRELPLRAVAETKFSNVDKLTKAGEQPVRLCNYTDVYNNDYITEDIEFMEATASQPEIDKFRLQVGDVIITKDSETPYDIGIPARVDYAADDLVCGYHLALLRPNQEVVDPDYLSKQLGHARLAGYFARMANGLTRYGLSIGAIDGAPVWIPPLVEQQQIGHVLRKIDIAIEHTKALLTKFKQVQSGLLNDLLTRGIDENGDIRNVQHENGFVDTPIGCLPRAWKIERLAATADRTENSFIDGDWIEAPHIRSEGVRLVQTGNIGIGKYLDKSDDKKYISQASFDALRCKPILPGDVLICRLADPVGRACLVPDNLGSAITSVDVTIYRPDANRLASGFIVRWLNTHGMLLRCSLLAAGTTRLRISRTNLGAMLVPVPSRDEQNEIARILDHADADIEVAEGTLAKLSQLKAGLADDLLTGRARVPANLELA